VTRRLLLAVVLLMLVAGCGDLADRLDTVPTTTTVTTAAPTTTTVAAAACDPTLWRHVYHPARLKVVRACLTVQGTILRVRHERDGDLHILLVPDTAFRWTLKPANVARQHGALVLEPVCVDPPTQADAKPACAGYRSPLVVPPVGAHVRVTGAYVLDVEHGSWAELHPVTSIEKIR
jgi:hypothetical protein